MLTARLPLLSGAVVAAVLLLAGCSDPAPAPAPGGAPTSASASARPTSSSAAPSASAPQPSTRGEATVVPDKPVETAAPKRLDEPTSTGGATFALTSVQAQTIKGNGRGDAGGPGVLVKLKLTNTTGKTLDTGFVQVSVSNAAGDPGSAFEGPPTDRVPSSVKAGRSAEGTYAFQLDGATNGPVTVLVSLRAGEPVQQFRGQVG